MRNIHQPVNLTTATPDGNLLVVSNAMIAEWWMSGMTQAQIVTETGFSRRQIEYRIARMQAAGEVPEVVRRWSDREISTLRELTALGVSDEAIAKELGRTTIAIFRKRAKLRLRKPR